LFSSTTCLASARLIGCAVSLFLLATSGVFAQDNNAKIIAAWTQVKQAGEVSILGIARLDSKGELTFDSAILTTPVRIVPKIDDSAEGIKQIKNGDKSKSVLPVILTGNYKLKDDSDQSRRFAYRPASFSATKIRVLAPKEVEAIVKDVLPDAIRQEDYKRKLVPLKLENLDVYIRELKSKSEVVSNGKNQAQINSLTMTLSNFTRLPEGFDFEMPKLQITDSQGEIETFNPSKLRNKNPDSRRYNYLLKRKPEGKVTVTISATDQDGSEKSIKCVIPAKKQRKELFRNRGIPVPSAGIHVPSA